MFVSCTRSHPASCQPLTIYHQPANRFVASFVGTNNFLPVVLRDNVPYLCDAAIGHIQGLPAGLGKTQQVASIRPEHIELQTGDSDWNEVNESGQNDGYMHFPATVHYQSFAGRELRLTAGVADGLEVQLITEPRQEYLDLSAHSPITLRVRNDRISFYEVGDTGVRL